MRVLVTGGAGFIGSHVVEALLRRGDAVTVLDDLSSGQRANLPTGATLVVGDVAEAARVAGLSETAEAIIHLAAIASVPVCEGEPERAHRTNVEGTEAVFAAAASRGIPVVYASSAAVYGDNPDLPLAETALPRPLGHYGRHKLENEAIAARYEAHVASTGLRFFNVYGPRQDPKSPYSGVISIFAEKAQNGQTLTFYGDGEQTRDFIYVGDIARLVLRALETSRGVRLFNGCTGRATSLKQLAATLGDVLQLPLATAYASARAGDIRHSLGNPDHARNALGFEAKTMLDEGLRHLLGAAQ